MESHLDIVQASQSEPITVIVDQGEEQQDVKIPRALVGRTSHLLADMVKKSNGVLNFQQQPAAAVLTFIGYCYQGRLELDENLEGEKRHGLKRNMIELWTFCAEFGILKLQNEAMQALLVNVTVPHLISKRDVMHVWEQSPDTDYGLKWFVVFALVAQMEEGTGEKKTRIEAFGSCAAAPGFMVMLYKALQQWNKYEMPKTPKKGKARTKWSIFVASEDVKKAVLVSEKKPEVVNASEGAKETVVVREKKAVAVKRESPQDGEDEGTPSKNAKGFTPGEVIEIDD